MTIQTKYRIGDSVVFVYNNEIVTLEVDSISVECNRKWQTVQYTFLINKATNSLDNDETFTVDEEDCFESIDELAEYYKKKSERKG